MRMCPLYMMRMIVTGPVMLRLVILHQQAFAMMPAITKNVIVFLTPGSALIFAQTVPFAMRMSLQSFGHFRYHLNMIPRCLEEKAEVNVHQAIEAKLLVNPADFGQERAAKRHQISFNRVCLRSWRLLKLAQIFSHQTIWA